MADPFSTVHDGLWDLLEASSSFTSLVKEENRIKFTNSASGKVLRRPQKDALVESDVPEVMIYPGPTRFYERRACAGAQINKVFMILVTSGDRLLDTGKFFPVQWAITQALWVFDPLLLLTYEDEVFVRKLELLPTVEGLDESDQNRTLKGWSAVWQADIHMWFSNTVLSGG